MIVQERYAPYVMAANSTRTITSQSIGGFLPKTAGAIAIVNSAGVTLLDAFPLTAGIYVPLPMYVGGPNATVTLSGGASGTLLA